MIINNKHTELGLLISFFIRNKCYLNVSYEELNKEMYACFYDSKEEMNLDYRRFVILSRPNEMGLIVYGDITENGDIVYDLSSKEIVNMYEKWVKEGKPEKELSQKHSSNPSMVACRLPRLYGEETDDILHNLAYSDFEDEKDLDKSCQILKDWIYKNIPNGFVKELKRISGIISLSELCDKLMSIKGINSVEDDDCNIPEEAVVGFDDYDDEEVISEVAPLKK